jgi:hypothetical protein
MGRCRMKIPFTTQKSDFSTSQVMGVAVGVLLEVGSISMVEVEVEAGRFVLVGEVRSSLEGVDIGEGVGAGVTGLPQAERTRLAGRRMDKYALKGLMPSKIPRALE